MIDETLFSIHTNSFYCSFTPALFCDYKKAQNKFGFTFGRYFCFEICKPYVCHRSKIYNDDGGEGEQGWKKYRSTCRGRGRRWGGIFFLKTLLAPRLAIVAHEKNGKTIFCRFAPSSPRSALLYYLFFLFFAIT